MREGPRESRVKIQWNNVCCSLFFLYIPLCSSSAGSLDCTARVWSLEVSAGSESAMSAVSAGQNILGEMDHDSPVLSLALHPAGTLLATGTEEGQVALWGLPHGDCLHLVHCKGERVFTL